MRTLLLLALAGCDTIVGIGDPYKDARQALDTSSSDAVDSTLIAQFPFEGNFVNLVDANAANCVAGHCPVFAQGRSSGMAADFNGLDECLTFGTPQPGQFSISLWMYDRADTSYSLVAKPVDPTNGHDSWQIDTDTGRTLRFITYDGSLDRPMVASNAFALLTWEHVAVTFDGNMKTLYVNGAMVAFGTQPVINYDTSNALVGCDQDATYTHFFSGMLDDVTIWKRALTPEEVLAIFNGG